MIKAKRIHIYLLELIQSEAAIVPIRTAFYLLYLSTISDISLYKFVFTFVIFCFEIPTGYFADKYGDKKSVMISIAFFCVSLGLMIINPCFVIFIIANIFLGISNAMISGSKNSFLMKCSQSSNLDYQSIKIDAASSKKIYELLLMLLSGFLFSINQFLPFILTIAIYLVSFILIVRLEVPDVPCNPKEVSSSFIQSSKLIFNEIWMNKKLQHKLLYFVIVSSLLISNFDFYNIYFERAGIPFILYGSIYASFMLIGFLGVKLFKKNLSTKIQLLLKLGIPISFVLISIQSVVTILIAIILQQTMFAFCSIQFEISIIQSIKKLETSSQYQSMISFIYSLLRIFLLLIATILLSFLPLTIICILYAVIVSITTFLFSEKG